MFKQFKSKTSLNIATLDFFNKCGGFLWEYYNLKDNNIITINGVQYKRSKEKPNEYIAECGEKFLVNKDGLVYTSSKGISDEVKYKKRADGALIVDVGSEHSGTGLALFISENLEHKSDRQLSYIFKNNGFQVYEYTCIQDRISDELKYEDFYNYLDATFNRSFNFGTETEPMLIKFNGTTQKHFSYKKDFATSVTFKDSSNEITLKIENGNIIFPNEAIEDNARAIFTKAISSDKKKEFEGMFGLIGDLLLTFKTPPEDRSRIFCFFGCFRDKLDSKEDFIKYMQYRMGKQPFITTRIVNPEGDHSILATVFKNGRMMISDSSNYIGSMESGVFEERFPIFEGVPITCAELQGRGTCGYFS